MVALLEEQPLPAPARACIMVVDDDDDIRDALTMVLECEGYDVLVAANGQEALTLLRSQHPCAVVTDLMMPGMNGWQLVAALREDAALCHLPICIISAVANNQPPPPDTTVLPKPIDIPRLLEFAHTHALALGQIAGG